MPLALPRELSLLAVGFQCGVLNRPRGIPEASTLAGAAACMRVRCPSPSRSPVPPNCIRNHSPRVEPTRPRRSSTRQLEVKLGRLTNVMSVHLALTLGCHRTIFDTFFTSACGHRFSMALERLPKILEKVAERKSFGIGVSIASRSVSCSEGCATSRTCCCCEQ